MRIYDADGKQRDWEWVKEKYNLPEIDRAPKDEDHWEIVELTEIMGDMGIRITTVHRDGGLVGGIMAWVNWPDGKAQLKTKAEGHVDFIMGRAAAYKPWEDEVGPIHISIWEANIRSDKITGLGWRGKTDHHHLNPTFQFLEGKDPDPGPEECVECVRKDRALSEIHALSAEVLP